MRSTTAGSATTGCASWGMTPEDALKNVREAIELYLEDIPESELQKHISRIKVEKITV